ncbi:MAG: polysaccharide biosynthesis C-terminal domain-containing protein [Actinomycetota bacterium]|nr:polysaccharide biosynthesis C-terminal domain-containing protein [Actinomycetota bacterium]
MAGVLLAGQAVQLLGTVMGELSKSVERPGLESRYLAVGAVVNVALTIPLALAIGMLGVPLGTAAGAVVSTLYFLHLAHREISVDLPSFLSEVPWGAVAVATVVTVALELLADRIAPTGVAGMAVCAVPAAVGLAAYGAVVLSRRARPSLGTA